VAPTAPRRSPATIAAAVTPTARTPTCSTTPRRPSRAIQSLMPGHAHAVVDHEAAGSVQQQWDVKDETGLRFAKGVKDVEFHRDVKPILERKLRRLSHTKGGESRPGTWSWMTTSYAVTISRPPLFPARTIAWRAIPGPSSDISGRAIRMGRGPAQVALPSWAFQSRRQLADLENLRRPAGRLQQ